MKPFRDAMIAVVAAFVVLFGVLTFIEHRYLVLRHSAASPWRCRPRARGYSRLSRPAQSSQSSPRLESSLLSSIRYGSFFVHAKENLSKPPRESYVIRLTNRCS